jgi:hypothetical protein
VDVTNLVAGGRAKVARGNAASKGRPVDELIAAATRRGSGRKLAGVDLEAKIASARAQLRAGRTKE